MEIYSMHILLASVMFLGLSLLVVLLLVEVEDRKAIVKEADEFESRKEFFVEYAEFIDLNKIKETK